MSWAISELLLSCFHLSALHVSLHAWFGPLMQLVWRLSLSVFAAFPVLLCYFSLVRQGETVFQNRDRTQMWFIGQTDSRCTLDRKKEVPAHQNETAYEHVVWTKTILVYCSLKTRLGLLIASWKIGLLGIRVGEAAVPGPATATQMQPNEENPILWETRGGGRASLSEAHSDVLVCTLQHIQQLSSVPSCE